MQPAADVSGVEVEHVADVLEGEEPRTIGVLDPLLRLAEELLVARILGRDLLAVNVDGVLQDGDHQASLAVELRAPANPPEVLRREECVGLEQTCEPIFESELSLFLHWTGLSGDFHRRSRLVSTE